MKATNWLLLLIASGLFTISCHKKDYPGNPGKPHGSPADKPALRLKDMDGLHLPSPFYHFEYNAAGFFTAASFSSGLGIYDVFYDGDRIDRMVNKNLPNQDILQYAYSHDTLQVINITKKTGLVYRRVLPTINASRQLTKLTWQVLSNNQFVNERDEIFSYYDDGNLKELTEHWYAVNGIAEMIYTDRFENYDDKPNPDAFDLLHPIQDMHLILLPSFTIQKNNPQRIVHTGDGVNYTVGYNILYDNQGRPVTKNGLLQFTNGTDSGKLFEIQYTFSYYD